MWEKKYFFCTPTPPHAQFSPLQTESRERSCLFTVRILMHPAFAKQIDVLKRTVWCWLASCYFANAMRDQLAYEFQQPVRMAIVLHWNDQASALNTLVLIFKEL